MNRPTRFFTIYQEIIDAKEVLNINILSYIGFFHENWDNSINNKPVHVNFDHYNDYNTINQFYKRLSLRNIILLNSDIDPYELREYNKGCLHQAEDMKYY